MDDRLDRAIRHYYENLEINEERLDEMKAMIARRSEPDRESGGLRSTILTLAAVLGVLAVALGALLSVSGQADRESLTREVISQAAMLHNQQLDVEVEAVDYGAIRRGLDRLGFNPAEPARLARMETEIIGARYSMIGGAPAVQIKFYDPSGNVCSVYQAPASGRLANLEPTAAEIDGVGVEVWREKGLLMVLARPLA